MQDDIPALISKIVPANSQIAPLEAEMWKRYDRFISRRTGDEDPHLQVDSYHATIEPIDADKIPLIHELTVGVLWPHRPADIQLFEKLGDGYLALDEIGRPLGSAMSFKMADDFAMLGMMVTQPRLQERGTGQRLLRRMMRDCAGRDLRLSATRSGYRLYESAGFVPVATIWQHQGIAHRVETPTPVLGLTTERFDVHQLSEEDVAQIYAVDRTAFGADRSDTIRALLGVSSGTVLRDVTGIRGYALLRKFGRGKVIGPVVAEDDQTAWQLAAPLLQECEGTFARFDTPVQSDAFRAQLTNAGLELFSSVTEMRIGTDRRPKDGLQTFGLAAHSLG
ncbi:MAG: GNAT family N-acetyltransferase [Sedimentitalea sp.]|uniref:GNAT family N-acetyltransferase n=1 Tax=Sedimentitalea sp. TaxID=2048915 RepID=UPI003265D176